MFILAQYPITVVQIYTGGEGGKIKKTRRGLRKIKVKTDQSEKADTRQRIIMDLGQNPNTHSIVD